MMTFMNWPIADTRTSLFTGKNRPMATPDNTAIAELPVFDADDFMERMDEDVDLVREVIAIFLEDAPDLMAALETAVAGGQEKAIERAAHTLKGAAANISAIRLQQSAHRLERLFRDGDVPSKETVERLAGDIADGYAALTPILQGYLTRNQ